MSIDPRHSSVSTEPDTPSGEDPAGAVGDEGYEVEQGDCISSIAARFGYLWQTIWDAPANAELKRIRADPNVLLPGDRVVLPEKSPRRESGQTEQRHRFVRKGEPVMLRLTLLSDGEPRANLRYSLVIDGRWREGVTDGDGRIDEPITGCATQGRLLLHPEDADPESFDLDFGHLDPVVHVSGLQGRLSHLGFDPGEIDGDLGPMTRAALKRFQLEHDLPPTGEPDQPTLDRLANMHGR